MPTRCGKSSSKYVGMLQFSTSLTSLEPHCLKDKYEALILYGNDKNASDIDKRIGSAIAQLEATTQFHKLLSIGIVNVLHECLWIIAHATDHICSVFIQNEVCQLRKLYNLGHVALYVVSNKGRFSPGSYDHAKSNICTTFYAFPPKVMDVRDQH
ncbi:hypothetical protein Tco_0364812 [Tanacetum coccineum]